MLRLQAAIIIHSTSIVHIHGFRIIGADLWCVSTVLKVDEALNPPRLVTVLWKTRFVKKMYARQQASMWSHPRV